MLLGVIDSCWLSEAGIPTLPAFGCGSLAVAHRPDEWIPAADYPASADLAEALVRAYTAPGASPCHRPDQTRQKAKGPECGNVSKPRRLVLEAAIQP